MATAIRGSAALAVVIGFAAIAGCGGQKVTVTGKVTHQGKAVASGSVSLVASDNIQYIGAIETDGTYSITDVPLGPVKIGVSSPNPNASAKVTGQATQAKAAKKKGTKGVNSDKGGIDHRPLSESKTAPPSNWFAIPAKYADPLQSGLADVIKKDQPLDIILP